jgi:hypothetical protein
MGSPSVVVALALSRDQLQMPHGWSWPIAAAHRPGRLLAPHREDQPQRVGGGGLLGAGLLEAVGERVAGGRAARVDRPPVLAVLRRLYIKMPGDLDHLAVHCDHPGGRVDLGDGEGGQLAPPQPAVSSCTGHQLVAVPVPHPRPTPGLARPLRRRREPQRSQPTAPIHPRRSPAVRASGGRRPASAPSPAAGWPGTRPPGLR